MAGLLAVVLEEARLLSLSLETREDSMAVKDVRARDLAPSLALSVRSRPGRSYMVSQCCVVEVWTDNTYRYGDRRSFC